MSVEGLRKLAADMLEYGEFLEDNENQYPEIIQRIGFDMKRTAVAIIGYFPLPFHNENH